MYFLALATDYDGTIAHDGVVDPATIDALKALKQSGRSLIMVTGRELADLERVCPELGLFDRVVAENGAYLYTPATKSGRGLAEAPHAVFVERLRALGVSPLSVGESIVATWEPNETVVLDVIRELGLDLQITFNKGAVMVLPSGINKASGLEAALLDLGYAAHNVVAVGDAENDLAFMRSCGCAVAVANALSTVKDACDLVMPSARGAGVAQLVELLRTNEANVLAPALPRHVVAIGQDRGGNDVTIGPTDGIVLISGSSGGGKSTLATALLERMVDGGFHICVFDPEGDYAELDGAVVFGDAKSEVRTELVIDALAEPRADVVINMLGSSVDDRPKMFHDLFPAVLSLRARTGRPHWVLIDEAHHMLPADRQTETPLPNNAARGTILITVHAEALATDVLELVGTLLCIGERAQDAIRSFCQVTGRAVPPLPTEILAFGQALHWRCDATDDPVVLAFDKPRQARTRHTRKYAEGTLGEDRSFYFRGPNDELNLRAHNLTMFLQLAEGVDEGTFLFHLRAGDYSSWFETAIKDPDVASAVKSIEASAGISVADARKKIRAAVEDKYTAPSR